MNYHDKTKEELIEELQELQQQYDAVKASYEKVITKRKLAEEVLPEPEILHKELMDLSRDVIFSLTPQGLFGFMNQAFEKITGWQTQEWIGKPFTNLLHPKDIPLAAERFSNLLKGHTVQAIELRIRKKSGDYGCTEVLASSWMKKGMITGILGIGRDITRRRKTEEALHETMQTLEAVIKASPLPIIALDRERIVKMWNPAAERTLGWGAQEVVGRQYPAIPNEKMDETEALFSRALQGRLSEVETLQQRKDGSLIDVSISSAPLRDSRGNIIGVMAVIVDITGPKKAKEALRDSEDRYRDLVENSQDLICTHDLEGRIISANPWAAKILGYEVDTILQMNIRDFLVPEVRRGVEVYLYRIRKNGAAKGLLQVQTATGERRIWEYNNTLRNKGMAVPIVRGMAHDITERKRAEEAMRENEMKLKTLFEVLPIGVSILDAERNIAFINPALGRILNMTKDGLVRGDYMSRKYLRPDGTQMPEEEFASVRAIREQRAIHDVETGVMMEDGNITWTNVTAAPVEFPDWKVVIITSDITKRKRLEEILKKEQQELKIIIDSSPIIVFYKDKEGKFIRVNKALAKALKMPEKEFVGKTVFDLYSGKIAQSMTNDDQVVLKSGRPKLNIIGQYESASGIRWVQTDKIPIFDENGIPVGLIGFAQDITERKKAEKELYLEKDNFRHSLDDSPLGVRIATIEGNTIYANKTLLDFYGYDNLEELQNTLLKKRYTPESYKQAQKRKRQRERGDLSDSEYEISIVRRNGEIRHLQVFRKEVLWDGLMQFQIIYNDITERKYGEEEIKKSKKLLEDLHRHLDEIRENERAVISREIHDQIGQSLSALKLDMNWMTGYIKNTSPEAAAKLQGMIELISNTIKDVQRISSDLRPGILDDLGLATAIEWYCNEFETRTGIKCSLKLDNSTFDDSQKNLVFFRVLQEAFTNIIRHAKASSVTVKLHHTQKGTTLTIQDNGIGITWEKIESAKSLGLIGMRERLKQLEGMVNISTGKGHGTKLTIFIPEKKKSES